jgi:hypothetical protein
MIGQLKEQKKMLIAYLLSKISTEDWHAVQDAASDIREVNAALKILDASIEAGVDIVELKQILDMREKR